jgi:hypothetical protein
MRAHYTMAAALLFALCSAAGSMRAQDSPHGPLTVACDQCHDTQSWKVMTQGMKFDHARTAFPLAGRHTQVACRQCHATLKFSEAKDRCGSCHADVHRNELGAACERCHSTDSWLVPDMPQRHVSTRFALLGAHRLAQCRACHTNEQKHTYAGAPVECVSCHRANYDATSAPPHRASGISTNCESCHAVSSPAWGRGFDHNTSGFPLKGAHAAVACSQCHQNNQYRGLTHDCNGCHAALYTATSRPPHRASGFGTDCVQCHSAASVSWAGKFDHATTAFPLAGSHAAVPCADCHKNNVYRGLPSTCYSCHAANYTATTTPPHQSSGLSTDCAQCHSASSASWGGKFDHSATIFPLTGLHTAVQCMQCHKNNVFKGLQTSCNSCHAADYTATSKPPHQAAGFGTDCAQCHTTASSTWTAKFDHATTGFALVGSHAAVPCADCHKNNVYKGLPSTCYSCHANDYAATKTPPHQASGLGTDCASCHSASSTTWGGNFNHATTGFPLNGSHMAVPCLTCHKNNVFKGLPADCYSCHSGDFTKTANPPHQASGFGTDCVTCHGTGAVNWAGSFNHSQTSFALTGRHVGVACTQCHVNSVYKGLATTCVSCHQQDYNASTNPAHITSGFPTTCETCHSTSGWTPSTFDHEPSFPISSTAVHRPGRWSTCADCHTTASNFKVYSCIDCHAHAKSTMDAKHSGNSRYSYVSTACYNCHPRGRE